MVKRGPRKSQDFWGGGAATKRLSAFRKAKHRKSGVCRDEANRVRRRRGRIATRTASEATFAPRVPCPRRRYGIHCIGLPQTVGAGIARPKSPLRGGMGWVAERGVYALRRFLRRGQDPALRSNFRFAMQLGDVTYRGKLLRFAAGAAVRSSAPGSVSLASCETHFARFCRETPPDGGASFAGANARGRSPLSLAVTTVSFRRKRWG